MSWQTSANSHAGSVRGAVDRPRMMMSVAERKFGAPSGGIRKVGRFRTHSGLSSGGGTQNDSFLIEMMEAVQEGRMTPCEAAMELRSQCSLQDEGLEGVDGNSFLNIVCGAGKSPHEIAQCMSELGEHQSEVVATRITPKIYAEVRKLLPGVKYHGGAHILKMQNEVNGKQAKLPGSIAIVSSEAGNSAVAQECSVVAEHMGCYSYRVSGLKTSNLNNLIGNLPALQSATVVIVVAGSDGALPSVIAGAVDAPVIAVPTSAGFATSLGGASAMLSSLNLTPPGVTVVGIDNGAAAAAAAARILESANRINLLKQQDGSIKVALQAAEELMNGADHHQNGHGELNQGSEWIGLNGYNEEGGIHVEFMS